MRKSLLEFLRCPICHGRLDLETIRETTGEIEEGSLHCQTCAHAFKITRFIPRFVPSDLYVRSFSAEWNLFARTQLDSPRDNRTRNTFVKKTGIALQELGGKVVLDAGCGMGRFSEVISRNPSSRVIGLDLSFAVEAARHNLASRTNVDIIQGDIMKLPFAESIFDLVFSIGALHHTSNPRLAFHSLVPFVKSGGEIAVWVYLRSRSNTFSDLYRLVTVRLPWTMVLGLSEVLANLFWLYRHSPSPLSQYLQMLLPISMNEDYEWRLLETFDWYSPRYQFKFSAKEVFEWFKEERLAGIEHLSNPVSVKGRKP